MDRLKGKVAMVVGAGSIGPGWGNGKATAATFAREYRGRRLRLGGAGGGATPRPRS